MTRYGDNYRGTEGHTPCPVCQVHPDTQALAWQCPGVRAALQLTGDYDNIFGDNISPELAETLMQITNFRGEIMDRE